LKALNIISTSDDSNQSETIFKISIKFNINNVILFKIILVESKLQTIIQENYVELNESNEVYETDIGDECRELLVSDEENENQSLRSESESKNN